MRRALRALTAVKTCDSCECCRCISDLLTDHIVKCALRSPHYVTKHELPISHGLSDNSWAFQNFVKNDLDIKAELCQTHATAIAATMEHIANTSKMMRNMRSSTRCFVT